MREKCNKVRRHPHPRPVGSEIRCRFRRNSPKLTDFVLQLSRLDRFPPISLMQFRSVTPLPQRIRNASTQPINPNENLNKLEKKKKIIAHAINPDLIDLILSNVNSQDTASTALECQSGSGTVKRLL